MNQSTFNSKLNNATKWSLATVICSKLITPLTTIVLARILAPEVFGIVTITTIIISFAEMFSEAGIGRYIIQREFSDETSENKYRSVGLWANITLGLLVWVIIAVLSQPLAILFREPSAFTIIIVASFQIILRSLVAVQISIMQRDLQFKKLFIINMITVVFPMLLAIPLAFIGFGAWAIIIGNLTGIFVNTITVWYISAWRPLKFFDFNILKDMFSFTMWSIAESFVIWLTAWFDTIIIGIFVDTYTLGLYRNSTALVTAIVGVVTAAFSPVVFTSLSRVQTNKYAFAEMFLSFQRKMAIFLIPTSIGFVLFGDTVTNIILGDKWVGAGEIVALWGSVSCIMSLFTISGEAFRAQGQPKLSVRAQIMHLCFLIPVCIFGGLLGFKFLLYGRTLIRFHLLYVMIMYLKKLIPITYKQMFDNMKLYLAFSCIMGVIAVVTRIFLSHTLGIDLMIIVICILVYFTLIFTNKGTVTEIKNFISNKL